jgi:uncharacterized protein with HEPN domain
MSEHHPKVTLIDILDAINAILEFKADMSFDEYCRDRKTRDAIYRNIEVMGEAANRLPEYFKNSHSDVPWSKIIAARNVFIHGYDKIDDTIVWNIVTNVLPELKSKIEKILINL